jgi:SAM-dependent methyltransferase
MLDRARQKTAAAGAQVAGRIQLVHTDLRELALEERFALAILATNTFMHLNNPQDQAHVLARVHRHLAPGGMLALDLFHPHPASLAPSEGEVVLDAVLTEPETGHTVLKFVSRRVDYAQQIVTATFIYDLVGEHGEVRRTSATFPMRYLHRSEAERMLREAGFVLEGVYGSHDLIPYGDEGERMLILARRPEGESPRQTTAC